MNSLKKFIPKVAALLALALLLAAGCADTPEEPDTNIRPNTFISSHNIDTSPDSASFYYVNVYWYASDLDGRAISYRYWVDTGDSTETFDTNVAIRLEFPNSTTTYTFYVQTKDNSNEWDATPASRFIDITDTRDITNPDFLPNTAGVTVPPNGASTSRGVPFVIGGTDVDGIVTEFQWAVDDPTSWTNVAPDVIDVASSTVTIALGPADLSLGPHIIYFRAIDNMSNVDESPLAVSINCEAGYTPELALTVRTDDEFLIPFTNPILESLTIGWTATVDFYFGQIVDYYVTTAAGTDTMTETSLTMENLAEGTHNITVTASDLGGNSTMLSVDFDVVVLGADQGILCINGVDWGTYGSQILAEWNAGVPWGNRTNYKCWDLFTTTPLGSVPGFADSLLGTGPVPSWMMDTTFFEAVVWVVNQYAGDLDVYEESEEDIMAYLEMGGNILMPTRRGHFFFADDLTAYAHISSWIEDDNVAGTLVAVHDSLTDLNSIASMSFSSVPTTDGDPSVTVLYTHADFPGSHPGFIVMPNGIDGGGKFCFIAGRNYRWDNTELKENIDVIHRYFFNIQ